MFDYGQAVKRLDKLPDVLTLQEVSELFDVPRGQVREWIEAGVLVPCPASNFRLVRFLKSHIKEALGRYKQLEF